MKSFDRMFAALVLIVALLFAGANAALSAAGKDNGRPYRIEISRLCRQIDSGKTPDLSDCSYVIGIEAYTGDADFFDSDHSYVIREIDGTIYRFDYVTGMEPLHELRILLNLCILIPSAILFAVILYLRSQLLAPFDALVNVPYELSKGNLASPLEENRSRFFGRFVWGVNMLRETMEEQRQRELALQKEKQTLLLSISHDIKTPLSAIKLYSSALSKGLYQDSKKQLEIFRNINEKADEIERFVSELSRAGGADFLQLEVKNSEFYLSDLIRRISSYYADKLALNKTAFVIDPFTDCIVSGDIDRSVEVLQNLMENAIKYGDGRKIRIAFSADEDAVLITVANSGSGLPEQELIHIFDSFWRGSNSDNKSGSGLGLYICRQLMQKMEGDIFAELAEDEFCVTAVFRMA